MIYRGDSLNGWRGASRYTRLLVNFLQEAGFIVHKLVPETFDQDDKNCIHYKKPRGFIPSFFEKLAHYQGKQGRFRDFHYLELYIKSMFNRSFRFALTRAAVGKSAVIVVQQDMLPVVVPALEPLKMPITAVFHDIMLNNCRFAPFRHFFHKLECTLAARCDFVTTVEKSEHELLEAKGIPNALCPTCTNTAMFPSGCAATKSGESAKKIMFVGAGDGFWPNTESKRLIFTMAEDAADAGLNWLFFIIGGCARKDESRHNIVCTGPINDTELVSMYNSADLVIVPTTFGTGSSNKVIEAFAASKPVLGTSVAFRGLDVRDGIECFIEEDVTRYIARIHEIFAQSDATKTVCLNAREFAKKYDYRATFAPWKKFLKQVSGAHIRKENDTATKIQTVSL